MSEASLAALSGPEKAAVLLLSFSSAQSAELISRLTDREAELLAEQLARARDVDADTRQRVLEDFTRAADEAGRPSSPDSAEEHVGGADVQDEAPAEAPGDGIRPYDLSRLERVPRSALARPALSAAADLSALDDLPVRCRGQLASLRLTLADLQHLTPGDVLLLGPADGATADLVAGDRCRLRGRLVRRGQRRALELLAGSPEEEGR